MTLAELLPCPFCGSAPSVSTYETESLWSHNQVTYTQVQCPECEISFRSEPGFDVEAQDAWNTRATLRPQALPDRSACSQCGWDGLGDFVDNLCNRCAPQALPEKVDDLQMTSKPVDDRDRRSAVIKALPEDVRGLVERLRWGHPETEILSKDMPRVRADVGQAIDVITAQQATIQEMAGEVERIISALEGAHDDGTSIDGMIHQNELRTFLAAHRKP